VSACQAAPRTGIATRRDWPLSSVMPPLAALPTVPAVARVFVRATLRGWHLDSLAQDAELVVSELAGNAVAASAGRDGRPVYADAHIAVIRVCLRTDGVRLLIEVWDQAPGIPALREAAGLEESGRGLMLVNAIANKWGWNPAEGRPGKAVWAELSPLGNHVGAATTTGNPPDCPRAVSSSSANEPAGDILARVRDALRRL
jgi:anti-sigma regulatory factor (Ser/Thr protein kinase)